MIMYLCLFFGSNGVSGGSYHYRVLVHIPILDHRFLRDYLTRNEPKLHVFNLLNWEKKVQRKTDLRIVKMGLVQNGKYFRQIQICLFGIFEAVVNSCLFKVSIEEDYDLFTVQIIDHFRAIHFYKNHFLADSVVELWLLLAVICYKIYRSIANRLLVPCHSMF